MPILSNYSLVIPFFSLSPFSPLFFCFFATELNAFKLKIAFLQLDEGLYVQHKKRSNSNANNNNNCKTHSAACLLRVSLQYFFLLLFSLFVVFNKDLLLPKFRTSRRSKRGRKRGEGVAREWKERYAHTDTQKCCYFWRT